MCGRFASYLPPDAIRALFRTTNAVPNLPPSWNVAPTQAAMVVRLNPETNDRHLDLLKWGLIPHFTKDLKAARKPINARAETVASSGMFRGALERRRCLVHADAFYEWRAMPDGKQPCNRPEGWRAAGLRRYLGRLARTGRRDAAQLRHPDDIRECHDAYAARSDAGNRGGGALASLVRREGRGANRPHAAGQ